MQKLSNCRHWEDETSAATYGHSSQNSSEEDGIHRCQPDLAAWATSELRPMPLGDYGSTPDQGPVAWQVVPSTYVLCADDRAVDPSDQRRMAAQAGECIELDSDHSPFLSTISPLADVLTRVVSNVESAPLGSR